MCASSLSAASRAVSSASAGVSLPARLPSPLRQARGLLASTDEGFEDAAATFPRAAFVSVTDAPLTSPEFAEALRAFCKDVVAAQ